MNDSKNPPAVAIEFSGRPYSNASGIRVVLRHAVQYHRRQQCEAHRRAGALGRGLLHPLGLLRLGPGDVFGSLWRYTWHLIRITGALGDPLVQ